MKIIFLDFDGVLNSWEAHTGRGGIMPIYPSHVERLNRLVGCSGAYVVISSTWRLGGFNHCAGALERAGFAYVDRIIGMTPVLPNKRGVEIQAWLDGQHETPTSIVILDDDSDMVHLKPYLVQTDTHEGLQDRHVNRALDLLQVPYRTLAERIANV